MDIESIGSNQMPPEIQTQYAVKLINMARQADAAVASIIQDAVDISDEAMSKYLNEAK